MKQIKKAILPVAGFGSRFLPATKAIPKEMLPILTKPLLQYAVEEALDSKIENMAIVINKPLTVRRIHDSNDSLKLKNEMSFFLDQYTIWFNEYFKTL